MATSLPPVSQSFDADATAYVAAIELMMEKNQQLARSAVEAVAAINAALEAIGDKSIGVTLNTAELEAQIEEVKTEIDALGAAEIPVTLNEGPILEQIGYIRGLLAGIPPVTINISLDGGAAILAQLAAIRAAMDGLKADNISTSLNTAAAAVDATSAAMTRASSASSTYHSWWGVLQHDVQLWGGALASTDTTLVSHVATWHIVLDGLLEATIAVTGAVIALGAAFAALYPTAQDVYTHLQAVNVVSSATGETIPPLTGKFKALQDAMQPQGLELYGSALNALGGGDMQALSTAISGVVGLLDRWGAEIDIWVGKSDGMSGAIQKGTGYLQQLGQMIADVVIAVQNLMAAEPGVAHFVLDWVDGFTKAIDVLTGFSPALDTVVLALHGFMLWGGLLVSMFANMAVGILKPIAALSSFVAGTKSATTAIEDFEIVNDAAATPVQKLGMTLTAMGTAFTSIGSSVKTWATGVVTAMSEANGAAATLGAGLTAAFGGVTQDVTSAAVSMDAAAAEMAALAEEGGVLDAEFAALTGEIRASSAALMAMDGEITVATGGMNLVVAAIAALSAAFVGLILYASQAKTATQQWVAGLEQAVNQAKGLDQIGQTYLALSEVTNALSSAQGTLSAALEDTSNKVSATQMRLEGGYTGAVQAAAQTVGTLSAAQQQLQTDFNNEIGNVKIISAVYGVTYTQAAELAGQAGANLTVSMTGTSQAAQIQAQMIKNLVAGYGGMATQAGVLGAGVTAVTVAAGLQNSKVQQLTQSWSTVMSTIQGPSNGFIAISQSLDQFNSDAATAGARMTGLGGAATTTTRNVTDASTKLQGDFNNTVTAMQGYSNSLMTAAAITGNGGPLVQGIKDEIAILIPMAGSNQNAAAQIKVLWQEAGGSATDSLSQIGQAVSGIKDPLSNLQNLTGQVSLSMSNLGRDASNLAGTMTSSLNQAITQEAQNLSQVQPAIAKYMQDLQNAHTPATQLAQDQNAMNAAVQREGQLASTTAGAVSTLSGNQKAQGSAAQTAAAQQTQLNTAVQTIIDKTPLASSLVNQLTQYVQSGGSTSSSTAQTIEGQLVTALEHAGAQANTAHTDVQNLTNALNAINGKTYTALVQVEEQITQTVEAANPSNQSLPGGAPGNPGAATGMLVPGYGGGDTFPAMLEPGEAVVPKHLTAAVAPFLKAHGVPGFAAGTTSVPSIITGGTTKAAMAAIAQDTALLAKAFPAAAIPAPAPAAPQFLGEWLPSALVGAPTAAAQPPGGGGTPTGGGDTTGHPHRRHDWWHGDDRDRDLHSHITVNLDGRKIWEGQQRQALRYGIRNNGLATGVWKPT